MATKKDILAADDPKKYLSKVQIGGEPYFIKDKEARDAIDAEISRAGAAEAELQSAIVAETERATAAEEALDDRIDAIVESAVKVKSGEKIISLDSTSHELASTLAIAYDSDSRKIQLKGIEGTLISEISADAFIKDGMLLGTHAFVATKTSETVTIKGQTHTFDNLAVGHQYLAFCFTDGAVPTPTYSWEIADLQDLVDVYTAGDGLALNDHEFSVKKASDSENFLVVDENGVAIKGVQTAINTAVAGEAALREAADTTLDGKITAEAETRAAADDALDARLDVIEGADTVDGSIKKALKDAKAYTDAETTRATAAEGNLDNAKVDKTTEIAGLEIGDGIETEDLQEALGLENLAYSDTASGKITVAKAQTISGVKATGNLSGSASLTIDSTSTAASLTKGDYTPAGSITGEAISGGSINVTVKDAATATAVTDITYSAYQPAGEVVMTADNAGAFQVAGTNAASAVTVNTTNAEFVQSLKAGDVDAATFTEGAFTPASITYAASDEFVKEGIKVAVGTGDDAETLIFSDVTNKGTASVISAFSGGSKAADTFSANKLPVVDDKTSALTGVTSAEAAAQVFTGNKYAPSFTGTSADIKFAGAKYLKQEIDAKTFTPVAATLGFSGTTATNVLVTGVNYDKANASQSGSVTINNASLDVGAINVAAEEVTVTVTPDAQA